MKNRRNAAITAAIACVLSAPLAIGPYAARADEASDLRANNALLQQRVDQLAQVGLQHPNLPPGTPSIAGSFPRSFLIPGTDTSLQIGGFVDLDASYFFSGGGPNSNAAVPPVTGAPVASGLPLPGTAAAKRQHNWFRMQASESRLFVETRTPTAYGLALTHLEFDFFGCTAGGIDCSDLNDSTNPDLPRLRLAYGTLGGFIAGQNWAPGNDLASSPEIFDFGGDTGAWGPSRVPQVGYKTAVAWLPNAPTVGIYAVQPFTEMANEAGATTDESFGVTGANGFVPNLTINPTKTFAPDGALVLNWEQPWGHFQLHGVLHPMQLDDGAFLNRTFLGSGGGFSGDVKPAWFGWSKDDIGFQAWAGEGLGHWANPPGTGSLTRYQAIATNYGNKGFYGNSLAGAPALTAANASLIRTTLVNSFGGRVSYQHWWTPTLRSTASFGMAHQDLPAAVLGPARSKGFNKELETAHLNLVWSPVPFINTGVEYVYDHRQTIFNQRGDGHILTYHFLVKF